MPILKRVRTGHELAAENTTWQHTQTCSLFGELNYTIYRQLQASFRASALGKH